MMADLEQECYDLSVLLPFCSQADLVLMNPPYYNSSKFARVAAALLKEEGVFLFVGMDSELSGVQFLHLEMPAFLLENIKLCGMEEFNKDVYLRVFTKNSQVIFSMTSPVIKE